MTRFTLPIVVCCATLAWSAVATAQLQLDRRAVDGNLRLDRTGPPGTQTEQNTATDSQPAEAIMMEALPIQQADPAATSDSPPTEVIMMEALPIDQTGQTPPPSGQSAPADQLEQGEQLEAVVDVVVGPQLTALALVGRVRDNNGNPLVGVDVTARRGSDSVTVQTDTAGVYSINLGSGQWTVSVSDLDYEFSPAQKVYNVNVASGLLERIE